MKLRNSFKSRSEPSKHFYMSSLYLYQNKILFELFELSILFSQLSRKILANLCNIGPPIGSLSFWKKLILYNAHIE